MSFQAISAAEFQNSVFQTIGKEWMLITAEQQKDGQSLANTMTASWGGLGYLWNKNVAFAFIRPQRYTKEVPVDHSDFFSLCFFGGERMEEMRYLGTVSGKEEDKIQKSGLTLTHLEGVPCFEEATAVLIRRKLYRQPMQERLFFRQIHCGNLLSAKRFPRRLSWGSGKKYLFAHNPKRAKPPLCSFFPFILPLLFWQTHLSAYVFFGFSLKNKSEKG